jgi:uncharacterized membrane protein YeaQ/YmgE (transglycosylase-associated protein family)
MLILSLFWLLLGILIGALANAAGLRATTRVPSPTGQISSLQKDLALGQGWLVMFAVGAMAALLGGWLGVLLLGRDVATAVALWVAVLGVVVVPWLVAWVRTRFRAGDTAHGS